MTRYLPISGLNLGSISEFNLGLTSAQSGPKFLFVILALIFLLLYGLSLGRTRALISLLGIYIAYAIQSVFPYLDRLHELVRFSEELYITRIGLFLFIYVAVFLILNKSVVKDRLTLKDASFISVSVISLLQLTLLITIIANIIPVSSIKIPDRVLIYFATHEALFYWFLAPLVVLLFMKNNKG